MNGWKAILRKTVLAAFVAAGAALAAVAPTGQGAAAAAEEWKPLYRGTPWVVERDPAGVWYAGGGSGVYRYENGRWTQMPGSERLGVVRQIGWSPDGKLTVGARGAWQYAGGTWSPVGGAETPIEGEALFVYGDDGALLASNDEPFWEGGGMYLLQGNAWTKTTGDEDSFVVTAFALSPEGVPTAGTQNGYGVLEYKNGVWAPVGDPNDVASQVSALGWSPDGALTVATTQHGVQQYGSTGWRRIDRGAPFEHGWANALAWGPDGRLAVGTLGQGVHFLADGRWTTDADSPIARASVTAIHWSGQGTLVAATYDGDLWQRAANGAWSRLGDEQPSLAESLRGFGQAAVSPEGVLTVGGTGVWAQRNGVWSPVGGAGSPLAKAYVSALAYGAAGELYAGTPTGLWQYEAGKWKKLGNAASDEGFASVTALAVSPEGKATAATDGFGALQASSAGLAPLGAASTETIEALRYAGNALYAATRDGRLLAYRGGSWSAVKGASDYGYIGAFEASSSGRVAIATDGLYVGDAAGVKLDAPEGMYAPSALAWSATGELAVGFFGQGVWTRDARGVWSELGGGSSTVRERLVADLHWNADGSLTAATDDGVWTYRGGVWARDGLAGRSVQELLPGTKGRMYALSSSTIWQLGTAVDPAGTAAPAQPQPQPTPTPSAFKDVAGHWGAATIQWGVANGIVTGYSDGTFQPDKTVTEPEFLVMLLRAFPDAAPAPAAPGEAWHAPYYKQAAALGWPLVNSLQAADFDRGDVARIVAATQGVAGGERAAIQYLLDNKLANGKTGNTVEGFQANDSLRRVEALQFIKNMIDKKLAIGGPSGAASGAAFVVGGVAIGDAESTAVAKLGQPARKDPSEYGFTWYVYNDDYSEFAMIGVANGRVVGLFTNADNWRAKDGLALGASADAVRAAYGAPVRLVKDNVIVNDEADEEASVFLVDGAAYATVFFDKHDGYKAAAVLVVDKAVEDARKSPYPAASDALRAAFERQSLDLANASRARFGLPPLQWNETIAGTAREHSRDMAERGFFDHDNPDGLGPFDRMKADGLSLRAAAENIAAGQTNAIYAHASWMNSLGHRVNILNADVQRLGVGVFFGGDLHLYYTQNFYTP
ncbi:CAP-associated domain-containing protein [Paenibacillus sp.]|uniref:CAP-associated domain-containing protein n=1 Tax=Paenibacillus sp. TaxID=58172 RepID=UPI002D51960C|nr:CAP-associated domain-containing protein [Paenibacillus sp.]HZG57059.1 CAP-associated domain-containing protein [Paenibacillus sp.]